VSTESPDLARLLLKEEIEAFLYREAERLDERPSARARLDYHGWRGRPAIKPAAGRGR